MAQQKSFTLDGKRCRLDARVPARQIEYIVKFYHVSRSDDDVRADVLSRASSWPAPLYALRKQAMNYALYCHRKNERLYRRVMAGC